MLVREVTQPVDVLLGNCQPAHSLSEYAEKLEEILASCQQAARENFKEAQLRQKINLRHESKSVQL